jgi:hypothetical protein
MDHFIWSQDHSNQPGEETIYDQNSVSLYNQEQPTGFKTGRLILTSHRLLWQSPNYKIETDLKDLVTTDLKQVQKLADNRSTSRPLTVSRIFVRFDAKDHRTNHLSVLDPGNNYG